jgi:co-chaperonin GroES (HSP10)
MRLQPMGLRIYLMLDPVAEKRAGSLYVPDTHSELTRLATVQSIGNEVTLYNVGDRVIVSYTAGRVINPVTENFTPANDIHRICSEEEILCKVIED